MLRHRELASIISIAVAVFLAIAVAYLNLVQEPYRSLAVIGIIISMIVALFILRGRGAVPRELVTDYLPLPLALVEPPSDNLRELFKVHILPAVRAVIELTESEDRGKAYNAIKNIREFFVRELNSLSNVDDIRRKLEAGGLYSNIRDQDERKNFEYSMASLIYWIARYRNLAMHSPRVDPDPLDVFFALRTALIYIQTKYRVDSASLYTKCPRCETINSLRLQEGRTRWLQEEMLKCSNIECGYTYNVKITPEAIQDHYKIQDKLGKVIASTNPPA